MLPRNYFLHNRYRIIRPLSKGGFGQVYEALDDKLDSIVAIKERRANLDSDKLRRAFEREAKLLANLRHPVLPKVSDHFFEGNGQFLVMEFIEGDDLAALLFKRQRPFSVEQVLAWADQLLKALEYLHHRPEQIIHRDIKPGNIKLTNEGEIFLIDFGLAKGSSWTMPEVETGQGNSSLHGYTAAYAPLEQLNNSGTNEQSDIYSLGATLYHLLTGQAPKAASQRYKNLELGQRDPLIPAHETSAGVPYPVSVVLSQAMAMNRRDRLSSATRMREALSEARRTIKAEEQSRLREAESSGDTSKDKRQASLEPTSLGSTIASPTVASPVVSSPIVTSGTPVQPHLGVEGIAPAVESASHTPDEQAAHSSWPSQITSEAKDSHWSLSIPEPEPLNDPDSTLLIAHSDDEEEQTREREELLRRQQQEDLTRQRLEAEAAAQEAEEQRRQEAEEQRLRLIAEQERKQREAEEAAEREREAEQAAAQLRAEEEEGQRQKAEEHSRLAAQAAAAAERRRLEEDERRVRLEAEEKRQAEERRALEEAREKAEAERLRREQQEARQREEEVRQRRIEAEAAAAAAERRRVEEDDYARRQAALFEAEQSRQREQQARDNAAKQLRQQEDAQRREQQAQLAQTTHPAQASNPSGARVANPQPLMLEPTQSASQHKARTMLIAGAALALLIVAAIAAVIINRRSLNPVAVEGDARSSKPNVAASAPANNAPHSFALEQRLSGQQGTVWTVAYAPDGGLLAGAGDDGKVRIWDTLAWKLTLVMEGHRDTVNSVAFSPDGRMLASGSTDQTIRIWNIANGAALKTLREHKGKVLSVAFSPDNRLLARGGDDKTVGLWDIASGEAKPLSGHGDEVWSVAFAPDGETLVSADKSQSIRLWDIKKGTKQDILKASGAMFLVFSPDKTTLASGHHDGSIKLWNWKTGQETKALAGHEGYVASLAFNADGSILASAGKDKTIKLWDARTGALKQTLSVQEASVESISFSPDGRTLISGGRDQVVRVWQ